MSIMNTTPLTLGLLAGLALATPVVAQDADGLQEKFDAKVAAEWVAQGGWITDYDMALAKAKKEGKYVFAYFSRSYSP